MLKVMYKIHTQTLMIKVHDYFITLRQMCIQSIFLFWFFMKNRFARLEQNWFHLTWLWNYSFIVFY